MKLFRNLAGLPRDELSERNCGQRKRSGVGKIEGLHL
jgi:hypothetical protein